LYDYHFEITGRLIERAEDISLERYSSAENGGGRSLHDLLLHILATDRGWRIGLQTGARPKALDPGEHADLPALRGLAREENLAWSRFLDELEADTMQAEAEFSAGPGQVMRIPRWRVLHHVILHGMQHHAEAAQILTRHGSSPGDLDFIFFRSQQDTPSP
jgi:uncharacterized damage-inducible protein DinB